jgi:hypothetical protein
MVRETEICMFNSKKEKELESKALIAGVNLNQLTPEIREAFANDYVETLRKGKLIYSRDFYKAMLKYINQGMTYVEAYRACGFDVDALGTDRANAAGKRAVAMDRDGSLYKVLPTDMNATIPLDQMDPDMDDEHKLAYFQARCMYLEAELEYEKEKKRLLYQEALSRSKKEKKKK